MTSEASEEAHRAAARRREYEVLLEQRSGLLAVDTSRYSLLERSLYRCRPTGAGADESAFKRHHDETERLVANVLAALARLARHVDRPL